MHKDAEKARKTADRKTKWKIEIICM
jgi:hypothetical protein